MTSAENVARRLAKALAVDETYHALDEYKIKRRRIFFIGNDDEKRAGGYGIVRKAHLHGSSYLPSWFASRQIGQAQVVAVKEIKLSGMHDPSELKRAFTKEVLVWSRLKGHPGIAKFLGFCADFGRSEAWLISPWETYGNVSEFIKGHSLEVPERLSLAYDSIDALEFLHQMDPPVIHGDIKSANVLVNSECRAVLCDFGLARIYEDSGFSRLETTAGFKGSLRWCSPELLNGQPRTACSDIYAWAWLVWEIMTGELPYQEAVADYVIMRKIFESPLPQVNGESRLSDCLQLWELMRRCWAVEPPQRPTSAMCKLIFEYLPHYPPTAKNADPHIRSPVVLENLGELEGWKGNDEAQLAHLEAALNLFEQEGNDKGVARILLKQAAVASRGSNHLKAMNAAKAALARYRSLQDDGGIADALFWVGFLFLEENNTLDASRNLEESAKMFRAQGNSVRLAECLERLGELYRREGVDEKALSVSEEAVDIASHCGDRLGEAAGLIAIGHMRWSRNDLDQAISAFQMAHDIARTVGWEPGLSTCLCRLGIIKLEQGNHPEAEQLLRESVGVARDSDAGWRLAQGLSWLGKCFREQGRHEEGVSALEESCSVYQGLALEFVPELAYTATLLADSKSLLGHNEQALVWYDIAIAEYRKSRNKYKGSLSECLAERDIILASMNQDDEGVVYVYGEAY